MGFHQFNDFNLALLAKLSWRILTTPDSLWVRVLKSRYFPDTTFMNARSGASPSWIWNSILAGRHLMSPGICTQIGNALNTSIWCDNWVPNFPHLSTPHQQQHQAHQQPHLTVDSLIDWDRYTWNLTPISPSITTAVANAIQSIPLISPHLIDKLVWSLEKNGLFSIRSAYHLQRSLHPITVNSPQSSHQISVTVWKWIWHISSLPKIQNFLWRACSNALATKANLHHRYLSLSPICPLCQLALETIEHVLFVCPWTSAVWFGHPLGIKILPASITSFDRWIE